MTVLTTDSVSGRKPQFKLERRKPGSPIMTLKRTTSGKVIPLSPERQEILQARRQFLTTRGRTDTKAIGFTRFFKDLVTQKRTEHTGDSFARLDTTTIYPPLFEAKFYPGSYHDGALSAVYMSDTTWGKITGWEATNKPLDRQSLFKLFKPSTIQKLSQAEQKELVRVANELYRIRYIAGGTERLDGKYVYDLTAKRIREAKLSPRGLRLLRAMVTSVYKKNGQFDTNVAGRLWNNNYRTEEERRHIDSAYGKGLYSHFDVHTAHPHEFLLRQMATAIDKTPSKLETEHRDKLQCPVDDGKLYITEARRKVWAQWAQNLQQVRDAVLPPWMLVFKYNMPTSKLLDTENHRLNDNVASKLNYIYVSSLQNTQSASRTADQIKALFKTLFIPVTAA